MSGSTSTCGAGNASPPDRSPDLDPDPRFYAANRADLVAIRRKNITDISTSDINRFLGTLEGLGPVSRNTIRRHLITMFSFAKKQGYLHPDRKTATELSESLKEPDTKIEIFTPDEMRRILLAANARILPLIAIGGFAGIRSAEILRLDGEDIKWDRGYIEIAGSKAKTAVRRLVPLTDNLKAWLTPWRGEKGKILTISDDAGALSQRHRREGERDYGRTCKPFQRLQQLLCAHVPLPGKPFRRSRGGYVPLFQISLNATLVPQRQ